MSKLSGGIVGVDGNAFSIMGKFRADAKKAGWENDRIKSVLDDAMDGDYNHLLSVISSQYDDPMSEAE